MVIENKNVQDCIVKIVEKYPFVKNIFQEIDRAGGRVLLVGGAVRDFFLGIEPKDLDFEVYCLTFDQLYALLKKHGAVNLVGKSFGVLRLFMFDADFSLPRKDSSGRKPEVFIDSNMPYQESFRRRDLTVNAMGIDVNRYELIDPFGGLHDLQSKILRSPDVTLFVEDPLRLFRVMQFAGRLECVVDEKLSELCRTMNISQVSRERVEDEFKKLFMRSKKPSIGLRWLEEIGITNQLFPEVVWSEKICKTMDAVAERDEISEDLKLLFSWASIFLHLSCVQNMAIDVHHSVDREHLKKVIKIIGQSILSVEQKRTIGQIIVYVNYFPELVEQREPSLYKWLAWWLNHTISMHDLSLFARCFLDEKIVGEAYEMFVECGVLKKAEEPLFTGRDALKYVQEGPKLGELVDQAYQLQINESIQDKKILLSRLNL